MEDDNKDEMILYKYMTLERFLGSFDDYMAGKAYFADWSRMNDPMEGYFRLPNLWNRDEKYTVYEKLRSTKICSLAKSGVNLALWANYAGNHTGVCVGFIINHDATIDEVEVDYRDNLRLTQEEERTAQVILGRKRKDWEYEHEYRLLVAADEAGMRNIGTVKGIILGRDCPLRHLSSVFKEEAKAKFRKIVIKAGEVQTPLPSIDTPEYGSNAEWGYEIAEKHVTLLEYLGTATAVTVPKELKNNPVVAVSEEAFSLRNSIISVIIPESVTSIGEGTFASCSSLTSINIEDGNKNYCSVDGVLYNKDKTTLIQYPNGKKDVSYSIPEGVISIGYEAFFDCDLTSVVLSKGIISITTRAFFDCDLTSVTIPKGVTSIGEMAFALCRCLISVIFEGDDITEDNFEVDAFDGDLHDKYFALGGGAGTYTRDMAVSNTWTKR